MFDILTFDGPAQSIENTVMLTELPLPLLPPLVALLLLAYTRSAGWSLFIGSLTGVLLIGNGPFYSAPLHWFTDHFLPAIVKLSHWSAILFTLLLAAFAAVIERSGALAKLLQAWSQKGNQAATSRLQLSVVALGFLCFFDGLANALMLGRVSRTLADQASVSREKLAYLVDTTSSAVACVAFLSTWTITQLTYISQNLAESAYQTPSYLLFLQSIPYNFYCLGSLFLVVLSAYWNWNPSTMAKAKPRPLPLEKNPAVAIDKGSRRAAFGPIAILLASVPFSFWVIGGNKPFPTSVEDIQRAFSSNLGPYALLLAGTISVFGAVLFFPGKKKNAWKSIPSGMSSLGPALIVLLMAWVLGSTLTELETGTYLASLLGEQFSIHFLPLITFILGCLIAFSTGTSWGTMGLLMPLALSTFLSTVTEQGLSPEETAFLLPPLIAAVFGGAVFGDHASPFSDTTIVSALACDISTTAHVMTQLPYALLAASAAIFFGYIPLGLGLPSILTIPLPLAFILFFIILRRKKDTSLTKSH